MAIPDKPLTLASGVQDFTLDEVCLFSPGGFDPVVFRSFLIEHGNWTRTEIGKIKVSELADVATQIAEKLKELSVPLGS